MEIFRFKFYILEDLPQNRIVVELSSNNETEARRLAQRKAIGKNLAPERLIRKSVDRKVCDAIEITDANSLYNELNRRNFLQPVFEAFNLKYSNIRDENIEQTFTQKIFPYIDGKRKFIF